MSEAPMPLIRLEVDHMKYSMITALHNYSVQMDENIQKAIEEYCTQENLDRVIMDAAHKALDTAIKEEVRNFFWNGDGRSAVAASVRESLLKRETYTVLDDVEGK